jgi:hypothetical protein
MAIDDPDLHLHPLTLKSSKILEVLIKMTGEETG